MATYSYCLKCDWDWETELKNILLIIWNLNSHICLVATMLGSTALKSDDGTWL